MATQLISRMSPIPAHSSDLVGKPHNDVATRIPCLDTGPLRDRMHQFLVQNLHHGVTLKDLARFTGYSEKYCSELFLAQMGVSFSSYVKRLRLERAAVLLSSSERLADIAERLGFHDQYAFSHFFKKATGFSPKAFRQRGHRHACAPGLPALVGHGTRLLSQEDCR